MAKKQKFYVVWRGKTTGVFMDWDTCKKQVEGFENAQYKSFETLKEAQQAFKSNPKDYLKPKLKSTPAKLALKENFIREALAVDAAWNTATGDMEYQGVWIETGEKLFHQGVFQDGTNNIGEFLAIVHALAMLKQKGLNYPIYSDSRTAIAWVRKKQANTKLIQTKRNQEIFDLLQRAEKWLKENTYETKILKWETEEWGENPADFGRK